MSRIAPTDLPQPVYPSATATVLPPTGTPVGAAAPVATFATQPLPEVVPAAVSAAVPTPPPASPPSRGSHRIVVWVAVAALAVVVVVGAVVAVALAGGKAEPPPPPSPPPSTPAAGSVEAASAQTSSAVNTLLSGVPLSNSEYRCVYNGIEATAGLAADIEAGTYDTAAAADVIAGCVSTEVITDLAVSVFEASGLDTATADCMRTELAAMSESSLAKTVQAMLEADSEGFTTVLATEAAYCFQSS